MSTMVEIQSGTEKSDKVRKLAGYFRHDTEDEVFILNQIYEVSDLLENFFVPGQVVR